MPTNKRILTVASTKTYTHSQGLSCCFRQPFATSHCRFLHGYALEFSFEFRTLDTNLDVNNWVVDFGSMKTVKKWLEDTFDHKLLVSGSDPDISSFLELKTSGLAQVVIVPAVGCEAFARMAFDFVEEWLITRPNYEGRVKLYSASVREHQGNAAIVYNNETVITPTPVAAT